MALEPDRLSPVRRTLAGLLFGLAYACAGLTIAGFLLQRTAFDPGRSADAADVVLQDDAIKAELVGLISDAVSTQLAPLAPGDATYSPANVQARVEQVASTKPGAELLAQVIHDAHAHLIGAQKEPVTITPAQLVDATQMQAAASLPPLVLDVPKVAALDFTRNALKWILPITAIATLALVALGLAAHPERGALFKSLGLGLLLLAVMVAVLGYIVPKFVIPALSDSPWAGVPAALADNSLALLVGFELLLVGAAMALLAGTGMMRRRQRWSTPVNTYRYQEERRWS
jgi:hypothetical protein